MTLIDVLSPNSCVETQQGQQCSLPSFERGKFGIRSTISTLSTAFFFLHLFDYLPILAHILGDTPTIIRSLKLHKQPLVSYTCKVVGHAVVGQHQHVSGDTPPTIRSLKLHKQPLVLHTCKVVGRAVFGQHPTTAKCKTRGCLCSFMLLMMGGVSLETC